MLNYLKEYPFVRSIVLIVLSVLLGIYTTISFRNNSLNTSQAATATALASIATAQDATATAQAKTMIALVETATAQDATPTTQDPTATTQDPIATTQDATETAITPTQTATPEEVFPTPTATPAEELSPTKLSPTIKAIFERRYLIAGVKCDTPPFGFLENNEGELVPCEDIEKLECKTDLQDDRSVIIECGDGRRLVGFDVDIMKEFAKRWLGDESAVKFKIVDSDTRIQTLARGEIDILAASMTHTKARDRTIDFSQTYFFDGQTLVVYKDSNIEGVESLDRKTLIVVSNTTTLDNIQAEEKRRKIEINIQEESNYSTAVQALKNRKENAVAFTSDAGILRFFFKDLEEEFTIIDNLFTNEPYALGVTKNDSNFRDLVNFTLQEMKLDEAYERLYKKWFGDLFDPYDIENWPNRSYLDVNLIPMLPIPADTFTLGSEGQKEISLNAFFMDQYEVTNRLYQQCVNTKNSACNEPRDTLRYVDQAYDNHPVVSITYEDAEAYCKFVGKQLPTENQWEAAARGTDERMYPWGPQEPTEKRVNFSESYTNTDTLKVVWDPKISSHENHVSPYGLHHMAGNVREFVDTGSGEKVARGGGWNDSPDFLTTYKRITGTDLEDNYKENLGFRCAADTISPWQGFEIVDP